MAAQDSITSKMWMIPYATVILICFTCNVCVCGLSLYVNRTISANEYSLRMRTNLNKFNASSTFYWSYLSLLICISVLPDRWVIIARSLYWYRHSVLFARRLYDVCLGRLWQRLSFNIVYATSSRRTVPSRQLTVGLQILSEPVGVVASAFASRSGARLSTYDMWFPQRCVWFS